VVFGFASGFAVVLLVLAVALRPGFFLSARSGSSIASSSSTAGWAARLVATMFVEECDFGKRMNAREGAALFYPSGV
jgi:hypothetical protein